MRYKITPSISGLVVNDLTAYAALRHTVDSYQEALELIAAHAGLKATRIVPDSSNSDIERSLRRPATVLEHDAPGWLDTGVLPMPQALRALAKYKGWTYFRRGTVTEVGL